MRSRFFAPGIASLLGAILQRSLRVITAKSPSPGMASACRKRFRHPLAVLIALLVVACSLPAGAQQEDLENEATPPRLSFIEGQASFWRPGAEDWAPARMNTPLAAGDALYTGERSNLELQIGARAFVRADESTQLTLVNHEPGFVQFKVTAGRASFDLRTFPAGYTIELDTPNAVFTIDRTGYYRVEVAEGITRFITRRGGRATVTPASGGARSISSSEEIVVRGEDAPEVEAYVAPEIDAWDRWNYARTDHVAEAMSTRYVSPGVYGAEALDSYGSWRVVPAYGSVWVPDGVAPGWVPYSTGSWIWDLRFGWTWVDEAPWGWAPFHYGRWIFIDGFWAWAPGPVVVRPVYAPALVAFFSFGHGVSVGVRIGAPGVCWVALGWGEPLVPWWGRPGFIGRPWWGGWGGPRIVNNVVINRTTIVNVNKIRFRNMKERDAIVAVRAERFGRGRIHEARIPAAQLGELAPIRGAHPVRPVPSSLVAGTGATVRPPAAVFSRPVVATRPHREVKVPWGTEGPKTRPSMTVPEPRIVTPPKRQPQAVLPRPPFGREDGLERPRPALPPRFEEMKPAGSAPGEIQDRGVSPKAAVPPVRSAPSTAVPPFPHAVPSRVEPERRESRDLRRDEAAPPIRREAKPRENVPPRVEVPPVRPAPPVAVPPSPRIVAPRMERERGEFRDQRRDEAAQPPRREEKPRAADSSERQQREPRALPGKPANRQFPGNLPGRGERFR